MAKIRPQRISSAKSFVTKKYNKCIWTRRNVDNLGIYKPENSSEGNMQSASMRCSSRQLQQWKTTISDVDGSGSRNWSQNQYQHRSFQPFLFERRSDPDFSKYSDNGFSVINDSNSSIYFGGTNHWLIPNNGLRVWQAVDMNRVNELNERSGLLNSSFSGQSWYRPKSRLQSGGFSGMRYQNYRPYGFNVFIDYSSSATGPSSQQRPFTHQVQITSDLYNKTSRISKFKMKDGIIVSTQRVFKSLRRTNTSLTGAYSLSANSKLLDFVQLMNPPIQSKLLVVFALKSKVPMTVSLKLQLFDNVYQKNRKQMWDDSTSIDNILCNYNQAFVISDSPPSQGSVGPRYGSPIPSSLSIGGASYTAASSLNLDLSVNSSWKLWWVMVPVYISGIQRGYNDICQHAGRQLVNVDKFKVSFRVKRQNRYRQFYVDFLDALVSQQLSYSIVQQRPITVTSTLFNGNLGYADGDSRSFGYGSISQEQIIKRNRPPFFFRTRSSISKLVVNSTDQSLATGQVRNIRNLTNDQVISMNNFRNTKIAYEVF